jgi:hypothetical protein
MLAVLTITRTPEAIGEPLTVTEPVTVPIAPVTVKVPAETVFPAVTTTDVVVGLAFSFESKTGWTE